MLTMTGSNSAFAQFCLTCPTLIPGLLAVVCQFDFLKILCYILFIFITKLSGSLKFCTQGKCFTHLTHSQPWKLDTWTEFKSKPGKKEGKDVLGRGAAWRKAWKDTARGVHGKVHPTWYLTRQSCKCLAFVKWWEFFSLLGNWGCHLSLLILLSSLSEPKSTVNCENSDPVKLIW